MGFKSEIEELYKDGHKKFLRNLSIDCVVFGYHNEELKVLLLKIKYAKELALPGGFILKKESIEDAAQRILKERTGINSLTLKQFHVFSDPERSTKKINQQFLQNANIELTDSWIFERFITIGFWAIVDFEKVKIKKDLLSESNEWLNVYEIPELILDHNDIFNKALDSLRDFINYHPIGYDLLAKKFTFPELQKLYETILNKKLDRRNFYRKIISSDILIKSDEIKKGVAHKAPFYYTFNMNKYKKSIMLGLDTI